MPCDVSYKADEDYIEIKVTGYLDKHLMEQGGLLIIETSKKHSCSRFLNDMRDVEGEISTIAIHKTPEVQIKQGFDRTSKRAVIYSSHAEDFKFYETSARNQGINVQVFSDYDEAKRWLLE